jgi:membrane protein involved in colicin uptake
MKIRMLFTMLAALALGFSGAAAAEEKAAAKAAEKTSAVQGEVLDLSCYMGHGGQGEGHAGCAAKCLKGGQPMGLLGTDGAVYVLFADHGDASAFEKAKELAGKKVEVEGEVATKGALKGITVHGVKAL